jgi:hypothetical protein
MTAVIIEAVSVIGFLVNGSAPPYTRTLSAPDGSTSMLPRERLRRCGVPTEGRLALFCHEPCQMYTQYSVGRAGLEPATQGL